ncbi:MAG: PIG-L family deacetylase [Rhodospirillales bacterium]|nr:PIG-L family deacetylase [Rhodospirillales bacterium]
MSTILVVAPHPDDETLGSGGTLLRHKADGDELHWLIVTDMTEKSGFSEAQIDAREKELASVEKAYGFSSVTRLGFPATRLDEVTLGDVINAMGEAFTKISPNTLYVPFSGDVHSEHRISFEAVSACCKCFRHPGIQQVIACEISSETDFGIDPSRQAFRPNLFVDISAHLDEKIRIMETYDGEMGAFPFPRSPEAIRALATLRGSQAGCSAAEAFMILKEIR